MSENANLTKGDKELLRSMGIAAVDATPPVSPEADAELREAIREPVGTIGRIARLKHADGTESRQFCLTQDEAVEWIRQHIKSSDDIIIENAEQ